MSQYETCRHRPNRVATTRSRSNSSPSAASTNVRLERGLPDATSSFFENAVGRTPDGVLVCSGSKTQNLKVSYFSCLAPSASEMWTAKAGSACTQRRFSRFNMCFCTIRLVFSINVAV